MHNDEKEAILREAHCGVVGGHYGNVYHRDLRTNAIEKAGGGYLKRTRGIHMGESMGMGTISYVLDIAN